MLLNIEAGPDYLRVEVLQRETSDEGRLMGESILAAQATSGLGNIFLVVRESPRISNAEDLAKQRIDARAFPGEASAVKWLMTF